MSFTYDPTLPTDRDKVRIMIRDIDTANPDRQLYQDEEIDAVLALQASDLNLSAAFLLDGIAANAALLAKTEKIGDYSINSTAMAAAVMKVAAHYRSLSEQAPAFGFAEQTLSVFSWNEIVVNELQRGG
ncbi:hypothetical protein LCGC14_2459070 [marine sediment metagenome]|uniref:Uncharacterized protein n=1 Tax=marine sediment metagenome TaxID=412755 RepID=A0A0F9DQZ7_9ZZZZ